MRGGAAIDLSGHRYGRLVVLARSGSQGRKAMWLARCDCGAERRVLGRSLRAGVTQSCGCLHREGVAHMGRSNTRHGGTTGGRSSRSHLSWRGMLYRTTNPKSPGFKDYGARGIRVCERWLVFDNFLADMGERPAGMSIDRIENNGNYEPGNCRWATPTIQNNNKRPGGRRKR